jgi:hypothetical protein
MLLLGAPTEDLDQLIEWKNLLFAASNGHEDQRGEVLETEPRVQLLAEAGE